MVLANAVAGAPADGRACVTATEAIARATRAGGHLIQVVDVPGRTADQLMIFDVVGFIQVWPVSHGCVVGLPKSVLQSTGATDGA
jgi:hypothetical protein